MHVRESGTAEEDHKHGSGGSRRRGGPMVAKLAAVLGLAITVGVGVDVAPAFAAAAWLTVDTGGAHACGIQQDGSLWCWGANESGQLGLGDTTDRSVPTQVGTRLDWASVAAGSSHTCALTTSGLRYCWGSNDSGQLGLNNTTGTTAPARRPGEHLTWLSITSGGATTCGITTSSALYCWGNNDFGNLGVGDTTNRVAPTGLGTGWATVDGGLEHTCGVTVDGTGYCWGLGFGGALGVGDTDSRLVPTAVAGDGAWRSISAGEYDSCGISSGAHLYCWGLNDFGELGVGVGDTQSRSVPTIVSTHAWSSVSAGGLHSCGLYTNGTRFCWGANYAGQLGIGDTTDRGAPRRLVSEAPWSLLSAGEQYSCGIRRSGALACWGANDRGQLGVGDTTNRTRPVGVAA